MSMQHNATTGERQGESSTEDSDGRSTTATGFPENPTADVLGYVSDMILELREISDQLGMRTLSGLLALSHTEAVARQEQCQKAPRK